MKLKKGLIALSASLVVLSGGTLIHAGTSYGGTEGVYVPGNNGSGSSSVQTKTRTNASSDLKIYDTTNPNSVDVRAIGGAFDSGAWVRNVNEGSYSIPNPQDAGHDTQLQFSTDLFANYASLDINWRSN